MKSQIFSSASTIYASMYISMPRNRVSALKSGRNYGIVDEQFTNSYLIKVTYFLAMWFSKFIQLHLFKFREIKKFYPTYLFDINVNIIYSNHYILVFITLL